MPTSTGIWSKEEAIGQHVFSYELAKIIGRYLPKNKSVYDFGCGPGKYAGYFHDIGFPSVVGVEGSELDFENGPWYEVRDLTDDWSELPPLPGDRSSAICLEVLEHVNEDGLDQAIKNITDYANDYLILSWAVPGQAGFGHISCRSNLWVIDRFEREGYKLLPIDSEALREVIEGHCDWFKNTLLVFKKL